jgi:hypothetical protein
LHAINEALDSGNTGKATRLLVSLASSGDVEAISYLLTRHDKV